MIDGSAYLVGFVTGQARIAGEIQKNIMYVNWIMGGHV